MEAVKENIKPGDRVLVICDFDGTITILDIGYEIIKRFAAHGWEEIDQAYCDGKIGSKDAYAKIADLIKASREEMVDFAIRYGNIDPFFKEFYLFCRKNSIDIKIVSDGLDFYIEAILEKYDLQEIEFHSNVVLFGDNGKFSIEFPQWNDECDKCGNCKSKILEQYRLTYDRIIYIGDGYSDVCPAQEADLVFAKDILYKKCLENGRDCIYYEDFGDVRKYLERTFPFFLSEGLNCSG